jgi:hypothetical protein
MHATARPPCPFLAPGARASLRGTRFVARPVVGAIGGCCGFGLRENIKRRGVGTFQKPFTRPHLERLTGACDVVSAVFDAVFTAFHPPRTSAARGPPATQTYGGRRALQCVRLFGTRARGPRLGTPALMVASRIENSRCVPVKASEAAPREHFSSCGARCYPTVSLVAPSTLRKQC